MYIYKFIIIFLSVNFESWFTRNGI